MADAPSMTLVVALSKPFFFSRTAAFLFLLILFLVKMVP